MKKQYINPEMEVVELNMQQSLLAGSDMGIGGETDDAWSPGMRDPEGF